MQITKIWPDRVVGTNPKKKAVSPENPTQCKLSHHQLAQTKIETEN